jgi:hypothetical protein
MTFLQNLTTNERKRIDMAENFANVFGQVNSCSFGGNDMGGNSVLETDEFFDFIPVVPDSMGGEVLAYILKKKEVIISATFYEILNVNLLAMALGPFYAAGTFDLDDDYYPGHNASGDANWTKALVFTPKNNIAGRLTLTFPYATPVGKFKNIGSPENILVPTIFRCVRGSGNYAARIARTA